MKPTKNKIYCNDSGKPKMLFKTKEKANRFIEFNSEEIESESGYSPIRSYFCVSCNGWHVTSKEERFNIALKTEQLFDLFTDKGKSKLTEKEREIAEKKQKEEFDKENVLDLRGFYTKIDNRISDLETIIERVNYYSESLVMIYEYLEYIKQFGVNKKLLRDVSAAIYLLGNEIKNIGKIKRIKPVDTDCESEPTETYNENL